MELKDQVCTASQGRQLEDLGVTMPAYFYHCVFCPDPLGEHSYSAICDTVTPIPNGEAQGERLAPAYTVAELSEMLPVNQWASFKYSSNGEIGYTSSYWADKKLSTSFNDTAYEVHEPTQAQSAATMLIYLLANNLHTL